VRNKRCQLDLFPEFIWPDEACQLQIARGVDIVVPLQTSQDQIEVSTQMTVHLASRPHALMRCKYSGKLSYEECKQAPHYGTHV
jgi:hypothetical protein